MQDSNFFLKALANGDSRIIGLMYSQFFPKVKRFVLDNKGQATDVEDIFQQALLQLSVRYKAKPFEIKGAFEGYFFTVCKNLWRRELKRQKKWVTNDKVVELVDESVNAAEALLMQKRWELMQHFYEQLSVNCNKVLKLYFEKVPFAKIVMLMEYSSESVARQRVFKCKKKLIKIIKQDKRFEQLKEL